MYLPPPPNLYLALPPSTLVPCLAPTILCPSGPSAAPVVSQRGRVRVVQYRDGVELVLDPGARLPGVGSLGLGLVVAIGACLVLLGQLWALPVAAIGLFGLAWQATRPPQIRRLLAHGASETFLLQGASAGRTLSGGATADLVLTMDSAARSRVRLRLFTGSGEQDLGPGSVLDHDELRLVRRFLALSGVRAVGTALAC